MHFEKRSKSAIDNKTELKEASKDKQSYPYKPDGKSTSESTGGLNYVYILVRFYFSYEI